MGAHEHHHGHSHAPADFGRAFAIAIALNLGFVAIETVYGFLANSMALLADAGHNLSDVLGLVVAWAGAIMAKRVITVVHEGQTYAVDAAVVQDGYVRIGDTNYDLASYNEWPPADGIYCTMFLPSHEFDPSKPVYTATKVN